MGAPVYVELNVIAMKANGTVTANRVVKANTTEGEVLHTTAITEAGGKWFVQSLHAHDIGWMPAQAAQP